MNGLIDSLKSSRTNGRTSTNVKVLADSNRKPPDSNLKTMRAPYSQVSVPSVSRRSRTSKRNSLTLNVNQLMKTPVHPTNFTKRKTMDPKLSNRRLSVVGHGTSRIGAAKNEFTKPKKPSDKFECNACDMTFFYKTSLAAHQKNHAAKNTCAHCDRNFAMPNALSKHLRENCTKISIAERKKLLQIDDKSSDLNRTTRKTPTRTPTLSRTTDKLLDLVYKSCTPSQLDRLKAMPKKNFPPITGIRHTPRKLINCYNCGEKFPDPVSYATHAEHCVSNNGGSQI